MIRRAYCIRCEHLHRRDPKTWTDRSCCKCGGEVRFSGGSTHACTIVVRVPLSYDELEMFDSVARAREFLYDRARAAVAMLGSGHGKEQAQARG